MPREAALGRDKDFPAVLMWTSYASRAARAGPELRKSGQFRSTSCELVSPQNQLDKTPHRRNSRAHGGGGEKPSREE